MKLTVLDGSMGQELTRRGANSGTGLWSAQALMDAPELVAEIHTDYIKAGARVIITNTYSTIPSYLAKEGLEDRYLEYAKVAGEIARRAADESVEEIRVAGSLPPLDESYRWDLSPDSAKATPVYDALAEVVRPYVDLFVCETMSCIKEAVNAVGAARRAAGSDMPVWVSWTLSETPAGGLRSGESIAHAYAALSPYKVDAFLFNCTTPEAITAGLRELRDLTDKPIGAYPNRFFVPAGWTLDNEVPVEPSEMTVEQYLAFTRSWKEEGASIIGGCCGIGPEFIEALSNEVEDESIV